MRMGKMDPVLLRVACQDGGGCRMTLGAGVTFHQGSKVLYRQETTFLVSTVSTSRTSYVHTSNADPSSLLPPKH
jgi:hypothetical protein